jgi:hypothetical protein
MLFRQASAGTAFGSSEPAHSSRPSPSTSSQRGAKPAQSNSASHVMFIRMQNRAAAIV